MTNAKRFDAGPIESWKQWEFSMPAFPRPVRGKLMLGQQLELSGMEVSLNSLPPGIAVPFAHRHKHNEELYVFLSGRGEMRVDDERFEIAPGTCIRVAPEGSRVYRSYAEEPLVFLVIQARAGDGSVRGIDDGLPTPVPDDWPTNKSRNASAQRERS